MCHQIKKVAVVIWPVDLGFCFQIGHLVKLFPVPTKVGKLDWICINKIEILNLQSARTKITKCGQKQDWKGFQSKSASLKLWTKKWFKLTYFELKRFLLKKIDKVYRSEIEKLDNVENWTKWTKWTNWTIWTNWTEWTELIVSEIYQQNRCFQKVERQMYLQY